jgi:Mg-chelatase subunit ChlD
MIPGILLAATASAASAQPGKLRVEIQTPTADLLLPSSQTSIEVEGGASIFGGVKYLDLFLVLDSSKSLRRTDPKDYRTAGAVGLVQSLPKKSDIQIGVVDFDWDAELLAPLTADRTVAVEALRRLDQNGSTDLADGIRTALEGFELRARADSSRVILLFADGKSDADEAREAMEEARRRGVAIHTLLLGSDDGGEDLLREIAEETGGSFVPVSDPATLPQAFLDLRTTGVEKVTLHVNGSPPRPALLTGGTFRATVPLRMGENQIVATATSLGGETREHAVTVIVSGDLAVAIDAPLNGTLFVERETETPVNGSATAFANAAPEILARHADRGIRSVVLRVNDSPPFATTLADGRFHGRVLLREGENRIVAMASSEDGRSASDAVTVTVRPPGCAELRVAALRDGEPAVSINDRAVEIVFDASNSMWGQIDGKAKVEVAREILREALDWLPGDLSLALRVYGHQHKHELRDCEDSELLVPFDPANRERIADAIDSFRPKGQTPLAYSLQEIAGDFGEFDGERAVVLVTDGIESCGGDPAAAARALQDGDRVPVHVIGFGLGTGADSDPASLRAIAEASGGRFLTATTAEELRDALAITVGTRFELQRDGAPVADGTLGADEVIRLPEGEYVFQLDSAPPYEAPVALASEEALTLVLERRGSDVSRQARRAPAVYSACDALPQASSTREVPAKLAEPTEEPDPL